MSRGMVAQMLMTCALTATLPVAARAQAPVFAASAPTPLDSTLDAVLGREIELARARGVPAAPLLAKVREGRLKRAPGARIRLAIAALAARLDTARAALGAGATTDELVAGADALSAGASAAALRTVRAAAPNRSIAAPLGALAQLVASGVPPTRAASMIVELLHRNATPAQVLAFGNSVESDAAGGVPAEESAVFRLHGISSSGQADALSAPAMATDPRALSSSTLRPPPSTTPKRRP
jgi:hypothetical protein